MTERIQKIISASGLASRRQGEEMLKAGRVTVNGKPAKLGDSADAEFDIICVDGREICRCTEKTYIMLNKPKGYVTTLSDEKGRRCVSELVADAGKRLYPVGRLDMYSEGLLIMTDDGDFANSLMHPSHETSKTYRAWCDGRCSEEALELLCSPLDIDGYVISPAEVRVIHMTDDYTLLEIVIHEGRNRQIRKMCEAANLKLTRLKRVAEGSLQLGDLKPGKWRRITESELQELL